MVDMQASEDVLEYIADCDVFQYNEEELEECPSFQKCVDHPTVPGHIYYEGYYHGLLQHEPIDAINPRRGFEMTKGAAPARFRAFLHAFKQVNNDILKTAVKGTPMEAFFGSDVLFSDLAIQVHSGDPVTKPDIAWHLDGPNSILHLAVTIGKGTRSLHYRTRENADAEEIHEDERLQPRGNVYLSSPYAFPHAVQYPAASKWEDRVVAVQCRTLFTGNDFTDEPRLRDPDLLVGCLDQVSGVLQEGIRLPTLAEVHEAENDLGKSIQGQRRRQGEGSARFRCAVM